MSNLHEQLGRAAKLAGMLPPASTVEARAQRITRDIAPVISAAIGAEIDSLRAAAAERTLQDIELMNACRAVGAAVDRLEQVRHTRGEIAARMALERAATALRRIIRERSGHDPR
ncbi:MAG: hypothetical protein WA975_21580 [Mesorhizobium sp.]